MSQQGAVSSGNATGELGTILIQSVQQLASENTVGAANARGAQLPCFQPAAGRGITDSEYLTDFGQRVDSIRANFNI
jgi:hypothetical protein